MARQLADINTSGELTDIKLGGTGAEKSAATKEYVDADKVGLDLIPQDPHPAHKEGRVFYDDKLKALALYTDIADVTHQLGQEELVRIVNNTGSIITNGQACRISGVDVPSGLPEVELSIATSFGNSHVTGLATHAIGIGEQGFLVRSGFIHDIDVGAITSGSSVFLSDTVPGGLAAAPPDLLTSLGVVVLEGSSGTVNIQILNHVAFPVLLAEMKTIAATYDLTPTYQDLLGYSTKDELILSADLATGRVTTTNAGKYRATLNITGNITPIPQTRTVYTQLWDATAAESVLLGTTTIPKDATTFTRSVAKLFEAVAGHEYVVRISSEVTMSGVTFAGVAFDIASVHIR